MQLNSPDGKCVLKSNVLSFLIYYDCGLRILDCGFNMSADCGFIKRIVSEFQSEIVIPCPSLPDFVIRPCKSGQAGEIRNVIIATNQV
jgi:hypothetical protein